ncbi:SGNH/GDSL hydrolase family protein [Allosalinactinospora lopnorensis]|uniref:SGNH/GDSL hydrolase family protein n=1 Tax=Allosalinactinospora lopnorensis TaxID=1352348 RepID=UPI0006964413|nr:SGNH/GDSL hydrolase family protein [Allosalinactinospora lopnorensis]
MPAKNPGRRPAIVLGLAGALTVTVPPAASGAADAHAAPAETALTERYVALGDSFTAGPFVSPSGEGPLMCLRSGNNYPNVVAEALGVGEFHDASCAMARTEHMTEPQSLGFGVDNPAQFDALSEDTTLVTLGIGGNDFGFTEILLRCAVLSATDPQGSPCRNHYAGEDGDELRERLPEVGEKVAAVLNGIRDRSPDATIAVVGYLQILPEHEGCWPRVPLAAGDTRYLDAAQSALNAEIEKRAAGAGAHFVDVFERGHDICADSPDRWVEGIFPDKPAAPVHPNETGMAEAGARVSTALSDSEGAPIA